MRAADTPAPAGVQQPETGRLSETPEAADPRRGRLARLSPAHGWPSFWTEIAIVVLGVLIALGAQQAVDAWNTRSEIADFGAALDRELADSLAAYRDRVAQSGCVKRKLDQLETWQRDWRDGSGKPAVGAIGRPYAYALSTSVWQSGAGNVVSRMPLDPRLAYADLYASLANYDRLRLYEFDVWRALYAYDGATRLTLPEVNTLRGLILSARSINGSMQGNLANTLTAAAAMGIRPTAEHASPNASGLCQPFGGKA